MSRISENIKKIRCKKGLSVKQLAKSLGVSDSFLNDIENGRKVINEAMINKLSKILGEELNDISMTYEEEPESNVSQKAPKMVKQVENINSDLFVSAFSSVLKEIPFLNYMLKPTNEKRLLPLVGNKIEGFSHDKVFFMRIDDNSLSFLRINKSDVAFSTFTKEFTGKGIYLVNLNGQNTLKSVKEIDKEKYLLISGNSENGTNDLNTKTINKTNLKILAKILKVEFTV